MRSTILSYWGVLIISCIAAYNTPRAIAQATQESSEKVAMLRSGEYLSEDYIERLKKTRSPLHATTAEEAFDLVILDHQQNGVHLNTILNFHEGGPEIRVDLKGHITVPVDAGMDIKDLVVTADGKQSLIVGFSSFKPKRFLLVGKTATYVGKEILAGKYLDDRGQRYEFRDDGKAIFPDRQFSYTIGIDHVLNAFDYFVDEGNGKLYGFRVDGLKLYIYNTSGGIGQIEDQEPKLILRKISS